MKNELLIMLLAVFSCQLYAQNSVSIGTDDINENAVLQLVSSDNNQGFLVPRMTTFQREAMQLNSDDNGMLVFDTDLASFFYWQQGNWFQLLQGPEYIAGEGIQIDGSHVITNIYEADPVVLNGSGAAIVTQQDNNQYNVYVSDADTLADNEIQDLSDVLSQGNDAGNVTITGLANPANNKDAATMEYVDNQISGTCWGISGNDNIVAGNYIGTTNNQDLRLRTNNQNRMIINGATGNVGINQTPNNQYKLYVGLTTDHATEAAICGVVNGSQDIYGVRGGTNSAGDASAGVHGYSVTGKTYGVSGITYSTTNDAAGVYAYANNIAPAAGRTYGVYAASESPNGIGIYGRGSDYAGYFTGRVYATGTITQNSDKRLKKDIVNMDDAYTKLNNLRGVYFYWNTDKYPDRGYSNDRQIGVIAQEVENVFPELVENVDGYKSVNYIGLIPVLIEVAKKQKTIIESQQNEIDELKSRIESIETALQKVDGAK